MSGAPRRGQGFLVTVGEIVGVIALLIAGLNYWESHQQHKEQQQRDAAEARRLASTDQASAAFVAVATPDRDGRQLIIAPLAAAQAIQGVRFTFPAEVADGPHEISAARPRIELSWVAAGLRDALDGAGRSGEGRLPVLIETTYIEGGDTRTDRSLYQVGYAWKPKLFGGAEIRLEGLALAHRGVGADAQGRLSALWAQNKPRSKR